MDYVNLGQTGLKISRLCLGCMTYGDPGEGADSQGHSWTLDEAAARPFFRRALEAGINFFDTANAYSHGTSEEYLGRAIRDMARRDEVVIATKAFSPWRNAPNTSGLSRKALFRAIDDSLSRLGMEYVDLFQIHRFDHEVPVEETMEALHDIVRAGKALHIGASSMWAWEFAKMQSAAERHGWTRFVSMQPQVNLIYREEEREMIPLCRDQGVAVIPWSPLARGRLTRAWDVETRRSQGDVFGRHIYAATQENDRQVVEAVLTVAGARNVPPGQIALAWLLARPGITAPIVGASKPQHLDDAIASLDIVLTTEEMAAMEAPYRPHPVVGLAVPMAYDWSISVTDG